MGYAEVALLARDDDFWARTTACHATETVADPTSADSEVWARDHLWDMAGQPGFGDAYTSAILNGIPRPGNDPSVISDGMILGAVQLLLSYEPEPVPPEPVPPDDPDPVVVPPDTDPDFPPSV